MGFNSGFKKLTDDPLNRQTNTVSEDQSLRNNGILSTNCTAIPAVKFPTGVSRWHPCH